MPSRMRCLAGCLAALLPVAGCAGQVPRYVGSAAKGQTSQEAGNDKFDCNLQAQKQTGDNPDYACLETRGYTFTK